MFGDCTIYKPASSLPSSPHRHRYAKVPQTIDLPNIMNRTTSRKDQLLQIDEKK